MARYELSSSQLFAKKALNKKLLSYSLLPVFASSFIYTQSVSAEDVAAPAPVITSANPAVDASKTSATTSAIDTSSSASSAVAPAQKKVEVRGISPIKNWISDRVEAPVRSCPTDRCRIVKTVRPGNDIVVTGYTADGWAFISIGEVKGFIPKRYLQDTPLVFVGSDGKPETGGSLQNAKSELDALIKRAETAESETGGLRKENYELKQELDYVKGLSNQTLMVNEENRRLKTEVEMLRQRNEILEQEARDGEGRDQRAWVIVGAGIILVGWFLGRFARMPRRKGWNQM